jgi:hypothetical protein
MSSQLRKLAFKIKNSTTHVRPRWIAIVKRLAATPAGKAAGITERMMPRDVATRWNSTYDMLKFAYTFREAIDELTSERSLGLRDLELDDDEWNIVKQLRDSLKVCCI